MSRTKTGNKDPGYEYWGKRPGDWGAKPSKEAKKKIHQLERSRAKQKIKREEYDHPKREAF